VVGDLIEIKIIKNETKSIRAQLLISEESLNNGDKVSIELSLNNKSVFFIEEDNFFVALQSLRGELEKSQMQILCNGAALNVYSSPMQMAMGGRKAYILTKGEQARMDKIVDIFDKDRVLKYTTVKKQKKYYFEWLESL
jgi:hypothetical protein